MRLFLGAAVLSASATLAAPAAAQQAFVASGDEPEAAARDKDQWRTVAPTVYTAWGHDFQLFLGTDGPTNLTTGARTCSAGTCAWAAGLDLPNGAKIRSVEFSACDGDVTQELLFALLRSPKVPGGPTLLVPFTGTGVAANPGCTTFTATLGAPETVQNNSYAYVFIVNSTPGTNLEWNQYRAFYSLR
jgi:hypothetical protein